MANKRQDILNCAKRLLDEKGYHNVSLRDIAVEAGTTIGNLMYHFPQKESLILELLLEDDLTIIESTLGDKRTDSLQSFLELLFTILEERDRQRIFFDNIIEISNESETLYEAYQNMRSSAYSYFLSVFLQMRSQGLLREDIPKSRYESLAYTFVYMYSIWTQNKGQYYNTDIPRVELKTALVNLLYPYLTPAGINAFQPLVSAAE